MDWSALLAKRPSWAYHTETAELTCEEGRVLTLTLVRPGEHAAGRTGIILRRPIGGCEARSARLGCLNSARVQASKHIELSVPTSITAALRERLAEVRRQPIQIPGLAPLATARDRARSSSPCCFPPTPGGSTERSSPAQRYMW